MIAQRAQYVAESSEKVRVLQRKLYVAAKKEYSNAHKHFKAIDSYAYTKLVGFMRRKHRWRGSGYRKTPRSFFEKLGLYHLHGKIRRWPLNAIT
jgi:hypothetical protein